MTIREFMLTKDRDLIERLDSIKSEIDRLNQTRPQALPVCMKQDETPQSRQETSVKQVNCWEFKRCGREPGGSRVEELGECPAATSTVSDGMNRGVNAGRYCWKVSGTMCNGKVQGTYARKIQSCTECDFFKMVQEQELVAFVQDWAG